MLVKLPWGVLGIYEGNKEQRSWFVCMYNMDCMDSALTTASYFYGRCHTWRASLKIN